jgi:hypothetical protein
MKPHNIFISLHKWVSRQDENFTSESFAYLLNHFQFNEPALLSSFISWVTGHLIEPDQKVAKTTKIKTQTRIEEGIPDITIESETFLIFIEVKLKASLTRNQIENYLRALSKVQHKDTMLVTLTLFSIPSEIYAGAKSVKWFEVGDWLLQVIETSSQKTTQFLLEQFIGFLKYQHAMSPAVTSGISKGIREHKNLYGENSLFQKRFKSPTLISNYDELSSLYELMMLINESILSAFPNEDIKFDTGKQKGGWLGYNINRMEFFAVIYTENPEVITLETFKNTPKLPKNEVLFGELEKASNEKTIWSNKIDLIQINFFTKTKKEQLAILIEFFEKSILEGRRITMTG